MGVSKSKTLIFKHQVELDIRHRCMRREKWNVLVGHHACEKNVPQLFGAF